MDYNKGIMDYNKGISDEILKQASDYIKELLKNKRLRPEARAQLEIQSYFLMFLAVDHEKISEMYPFYRKQLQRQERWDKWWDKLQWVIIPVLITALAGMVANVISLIVRLLS